MIRLFILFILSQVVLSCSCDSLVKNASKKAAETALSAMEGVAEAVNERGDTVGRKLTDAMGEVAHGAARSLDEQLDQHAGNVTRVAGRTLVQTVDGLGQGFHNELYNELQVESGSTSNVTISYVGIMKKHPVLDAFLMVRKEGKYSCKFEIYDYNCNKIVVVKSADFEVNSINNNQYTEVSFAFDSNETPKIKDAKCVKVIISEN